MMGRGNRAWSSGKGVASEVEDERQDGVPRLNEKNGWDKRGSCGRLGGGSWVGLKKVEGGEGKEWIQ